MSRTPARRHHALRCVLLAALLGGCEPEPTRIELPAGQPMVFAVLEAGADTAYVRITRVLLDPGAFDGLRVEPAAGAQVEIRGGGSVMALRQAPAGTAGCAMSPGDLYGIRDDPGCYVGVLPGGIRAGETYTLRAVLRSGEVVTGITRIPQPPVLADPADGLRVPAGPRESNFFVAHETIPVAWTLAPEAAAVNTRAAVRLAYREGATYAVRPECRIAGSHVIGPALPPNRWDWRLWADGCGAPDLDGVPRLLPDSLVLRFAVTAYDSAFARYHAAAGEQYVRHRDLAVGLTGAVGLFAGAATAKRTLVMVRADPPAPAAVDAGARPLD